MMVIIDDDNRDDDDDVPRSFSYTIQKSRYSRLETQRVRSHH